MTAPVAMSTSARSVVRIDEFLEPADVAALADAGLTAYQAAAKAARTLRTGDRCVVIGAGGLGHIGIQVLKALTSAELVVVDRNSDAVKLAVSIGADHSVVADSDWSWLGEMSVLRACLIWRASCSR
ncbi:hypothetical protein [Saccharopolyspora shandongensis]|uniref:hypothetical protein n=1 Tax=Saccharopolyspora shandongensis TaxID=418495 RepID=UPI003F4CE352